MMEKRRELYSIEAEKMLIGALLYRNDEIYKVSDKLIPDSFYDPQHKKIYEIIVKLIEQDSIATPLTVRYHFQGKISDAETHNLEVLLDEIYTRARLIFDIRHYCDIIVDCYLRRKLIDLANDIAISVSDFDVDNTASDCVEMATKQLYDIAIYGGNEGNFSSLKDSSKEVVSRIRKIKEEGLNVAGLPTDFSALDKIIGGFQNSDLIVLASRPSMGKTSLAVSMALNIARGFYENARRNSNDDFEEESVIFFSLEMSADQIGSRVLSIETGIDSANIRNGIITPEDLNKLSSCVSEMGVPLFIEDSASLSITTLRNRAMGMRMKKKIGFVVVDYLQLINPTVYDKNRNRVQEIGEISRGLKALAKDLGVPVLALSQLSRAVELREDKKPQLSDLRESGDIEQDADIVMSIWRPEYYLSRAEPDKADVEKHAKWQEKLNKVRNLAQVFVLKHRNGPIGHCDLYFDNKTTSFRSFDRVHSDEDMSFDL